MAWLSAKIDGSKLLPGISIGRTYDDGLSAETLSNFRQPLIHFKSEGIVVTSPVHLARREL